MGVSGVIRENWTSSDAGIATAVSSAASDTVVAKAPGSGRPRRTYTQTAPAVMPSMATLIATNAR